MKYKKNVRNNLSCNLCIQMLSVAQLNPDDLNVDMHDPGIIVNAFSI